MIQHNVGGWTVQVDEAGVHFHTRRGVITVRPFDIGLYIGKLPKGSKFKFKEEGWMTSLIVTEKKDSHD